MQKKVRGDCQFIVDDKNRLYVFGGFGQTKDSASPTLLSFFQDKEIEDVCTGCRHVLVKTSCGLFGFGDSRELCLGISGAIKADNPVLLPFFQNMDVEEVHCGLYFSLVKTSTGLFGFGSNCGMELGFTGSERHESPVRLSFFQDMIIEGIHCGGGHTIIETSVGLFGFGCNIHGQLGLGKERTFPPTLLTFFQDKKVLLVACGGYHSFVQTTAGLYGFGDNEFGQLGNWGWSQHDDNEFTPVLVEFFDDEEIEEIECGSIHTLVKTAIGLFVFGSNYSGQLGVSSPKSTLPLPLFKRQKVESICCGRFHTLVKTHTGIYGFGLNRQGQLGTGHGQDILQRSNPQCYQYTPVLLPLPQCASFCPRNMRKLRFLLMARSFCPESLLHEDYLPLDMFRVLLFEGHLTTKF